MKSLVEMLIGSTAALGLASCVTPAVDPEIKRVCSTQTTSTQMSPSNRHFIELPSSMDYTLVKWDRAYFQAINGRNDGAHLFYLRFESDCDAEKRTTAIRTLSNDELNGLGIKTREDLATYLRQRCVKSSGYLGPNIII